MERAEPVLAQWSETLGQWVVTWQGMANGCVHRVLVCGTDPVYVRPLVGPGGVGLLLETADGEILAAQAQPR